jgi:uncharacterized protein with von Willebrand factor type A (vWA) domain
MTDFIAALDHSTQKTTGENGHAEYAWSNDIREKIVQFDFQCVRTTHQGMKELSATLSELLRRLSVKQATEELEAERKQNLILLYKIIGKTRDIHGGKGEYALSYMMIFTWYEYFPELAQYALSCFVHPQTASEETEKDEAAPYGSWKDIKYLYRYVIVYTKYTGNHPLLQYSVKLVNAQLRKDYANYLKSLDAEVVRDVPGKRAPVSLLAKWIARESSNKFGTMYDRFATDYFKQYIDSAKTEESKTKAMNKAKMEYRKMCSSINKYLDTIQIKQAGKRWTEINHAKTTSITLAKQRKAIMNLPKGSGKVKTDANGDPCKRSEEQDRIQCAANFDAYRESLKTTSKELKGGKVSLVDFAKQALTILGEDAMDAEKDVLNSQWRDNNRQKSGKCLGNMIPVIDTSGSMEGDPMHAAIALGVRVSENSALPNRAFTFSAEPKWINLDGCDTFIEKVKVVSRGDSGTNTDFGKLLTMILDTIEKGELPAESVENMVLAIFSDMQMDANLYNTYIAGSINPIYDGGIYMSAEMRQRANAAWESVYESIEARYAELGMKMYGKPFQPPHILFWNLRHTGGFPTLSTQKNASMMSGFDPAILNMFCDMGMDALRDLTPYNTLVRLLSSERYAPLERAMVEYLAKEVLAK